MEKGIVLAIEERVTGLDGIKKVTSSSVEGAGTVTVEALEGTDMERLAQDVKGEVDRISSFPEDAETPRVVIASNRRRTMSIAIYGDMEERILREMAETVRDDLLQDPEITQIDLNGARDLEISVEISQDTLRAHGLTLRQVAEIIGNSALELPGGSVKTSQGEILVRVKDRRELGKEFANLPIISSSDGSMVRLEDLGRITDGFEDTDLFALYNNQPAILLDIYRVGDQTPISVSNAVKRHMERLKQILPPGVNLAKRNDSSDIFRQRMDLLTRNGLMGLCLVFILLALFLEIRLAFWVSMGIPISILGSFLILPGLGVSINMVSMFAFIITLGIVVDDAIVVGENVYQYKEQGLSSLKAATSGAREVVMPVTFSVLTNVVAFVPMLFVPGVLGRVFGVLPAVGRQRLSHLPGGKSLRVAFPPWAPQVRRQIQAVLPAQLAGQIQRRVHACGEQLHLASAHADHTPALSDPGHRRCGASGHGGIRGQRTHGHRHVPQGRVRLCLRRTGHALRLPRGPHRGGHQPHGQHRRRTGP